jgi:hypothetical protein
MKIVIKTHWAAPFCSGAGIPLVDVVAVVKSVLSSSAIRGLLVANRTAMSAASIMSKSVSGMVMVVDNVLPVVVELVPFKETSQPYA